MKNQIAVVTGANRGLGLGTTLSLAKKGHTVVAGVRNVQKWEEVFAGARAEGLKILVKEIDVSNPSSIESFCAQLKKENVSPGILVNNAGIFLDERSGGTAFETPLATLQTTLQTNLFGALLLCQKLIPQMIENGFGRVVNVSSGMGQLSEMNSGYAAYRISKTALNAVTKIFSEEAKARGAKDVLVNSVCPGWVKTDMGGASATRSINEGIDTLVWAATLENGGPTGGFFRDRKPLDW